MTPLDKLVYQYWHSRMTWDEFSAKARALNNS